MRKAGDKLKHKTSGTKDKVWLSPGGSDKSEKKTKQEKEKAQEKWQWQ